MGSTTPPLPDFGAQLRNSIWSIYEDWQFLDFHAIHAPHHANRIHEHVPAGLLAGLEFQAVARLREVLGLVG